MRAFFACLHLELIHNDSARLHDHGGGDGQRPTVSARVRGMQDTARVSPAKTNRKRRARPLSKTTSRLPLRQNNAEHQTGSSKRPLRPRRAHYERRQWRERHWRRRRRPLVAAGNGFCLCLRRSAGHGSARVLVAAVPRGVDVPEGRREGAVLDLRDDQLRDSGESSRPPRLCRVSHHPHVRTRGAERQVRRLQLCDADGEAAKLFSAAAVFRASVPAAPATAAALLAAAFFPAAGADGGGGVPWGGRRRHRHR